MSVFDIICIHCFKNTGPAEICSNCGKSRTIQNPAKATGLLPIGHRLADKYQIGPYLGIGGFGISYLAWDELLNRPVVVKEFFPRHIAYRDPDKVNICPEENHSPLFHRALERHQAEARTLAGFDHSSIVTIFTYFMENNTSYFVMPFKPGQTLEKWAVIRSGNCREDELLDIIFPVLDGLNAVHERGVLHRDIKPKNIYLPDQGPPFLLDFGAARNIMAENMSVLLTPGYAPFEQYCSNSNQAGAKQGPWTDIYALAATMYVCFLGKYDENYNLHPIQIATDRVEMDKLPPIDKVSPQKISPQTVRAIMSALQVHSERRPRDISEFRSMLKDNRLPSTTSAPKTSIPVELCCIAGEYEGEIRSITEQGLIVGRSPSSNWIFTHPGISWRHFSIQYNPPNISITDLKSTNGALINESIRLIPGKTTFINIGDTISAGGFAVFKVMESGHSENVSDGINQKNDVNPKVKSAQQDNPGKTGFWDRIKRFFKLLVGIH